MAVACDVLEEDALPEGDQNQNVQNEVYSTPNNPLFFDLKKRLSFSKEGKVVISSPPKQGDLAFISSGLVKYTPSSSFVSGKDMFVLDIVEQSNKVVDSDSVNIVIVSDTADLPCFNGALSDYVSTLENTSVTIDVLKNDGICPDETNSIHLQIVEDPDNGIASVSGSSQIVYTPNTGFTSYDTLRYELELTDLNGEIYSSTANVIIHVKGSDTPTCETMLVADTFYINTFEKSQYLFEVLLNDLLCDSTHFELKITRPPEKGFASITSDSNNYFSQTKIDYTISTPDINYYDHFEYSVVDDSVGTSFSAVVVVRQKECMLIAHNDHVAVSSGSDSTQIETFIIDVLENDVYCDNDQVMLQLNGKGNYNGDAEIVDKKLHYSPASFEARIDSIGYDICENDHCDEAFLMFEIEP